MASQKIGSNCIKKTKKQQQQQQKKTKQKTKQNKTNKKKNQNQTKPKKTKQKTAITLLGIYQKETLSYPHKSTYSIMFIETLFKISRI